jgi:fucose 4-O-acetylase-like acetyltransferase
LSPFPSSLMDGCRHAAMQTRNKKSSEFFLKKVWIGTWVLETFCDKISMLMRAASTIEAFPEMCAAFLVIKLGNRITKRTWKLDKPLASNTVHFLWIWYSISLGMFCEMEYSDLLIWQWIDWVGSTCLIIYILNKIYKLREKNNK